MNETLMQVFERVQNPKLFSALIHSESYFQAEHTILRNLNFNEKVKSGEQILKETKIYA